MNAHISTDTDHSISAGTIARTAVLVLALANQICSALGIPLLPIESGPAGAAYHRRHHHHSRAGGMVAQ